MDDIERIFELLDKLHDEVHEITVTVTEIVQWKKDFDENTAAQIDRRISRRDKLFGTIGGIAGIVGIIVATRTFI